MKTKKTFYVMNDYGEIAGHDLDYNTAVDVLAAMLEETPDDGWEIIDADEVE